MNFESDKPAQSQAAPDSPTVRVLYFAELRERAGCDEEEWSFNGESAADLYRLLCRRYGLALGAEQLQLAVNGEFSSWETRLAAGDEVVFLPPFSGG